MLELKNIQIAFKEVLLTNFSKRFPETGLIVIMGLNGCGKSSLLKIILGYDNASTGEVLIKNRNLVEYDDRERAQEVSMVFCREEMGYGLDVQSYLEMGRVPYLSWKLKTSESDDEIIKSNIQRLSLESLLDRDYKNLSDGEKQRVSIAKCLIQDTDIILLDEPTAHLDIKRKQEVFQLLRDISKTKLIIFVSHELGLVKDFADEVLLFNSKNIETISDLKGLKNRVVEVFGLKAT